MNNCTNTTHFRNDDDIIFQLTNAIQGILPLVFYTINNNLPIIVVVTQDGSY